MEGAAMAEPPTRAASHGTVTGFSSSVTAEHPGPRPCWQPMIAPSPMTYSRRRALARGSVMVFTLMWIVTRWPGRNEPFRTRSGAW